MSTFQTQEGQPIKLRFSVAILVVGLELPTITSVITTRNVFFNLSVGFDEFSVDGSPVNCRLWEYFYSLV
jgi:hypothetical protein